VKRTIPIAPVTLAFKDFELGVLSRRDRIHPVLFCPGCVTGNLYMEDIKNLKFTSAITVDRFAPAGRKLWKPLRLKARNEERGKYDT
jgi:hypothetical protein